MLTVYRQDYQICRSYENFCDAMNSSVGAFDSRYVGDEPFEARLAIRAIGDIRLVDFWSGSLEAVRGPSHIAADSGSFIGVVLQRTGRTYCERQSDRVVIDPGDIAIWHGSRPVTFRLPATAHKICMVVPVEVLEGVLPNAGTYDKQHLKAGTKLAKLLGVYLSALADEPVANDREEAAAAHLTLGLLSAALTASKERDGQRRQDLFHRVVRFIDGRLDDPELNPASIAEAHNVSVRYLYLVFGDHGATVSAWIRNRRLARSRAELLNRLNNRSLTEIALRWGFSDSSHFSRLFKAKFGISPGAFRRTRPIGRGSAEISEVLLPQ